MTPSLLTVVQLGAGADPGAAFEPADVSVLALRHEPGPAKLIALLATAESRFIMVDPAPTPARIAAGLALARRWPDAGIALDDAALARRERRMIRTEGLRFLDPSVACPVVIARDLALACLQEPSVLAAGSSWCWALAREAARRGHLVVDRSSRAPMLKRRLRPVEPDRLDAVIAAETGVRSGRHILVIGRVEASVSLYFDGLPAASRASLRFFEAEALMAAPQALETADAAIVVRDLERCHDIGMLRRLAALDIPSLYFTDDNPLALAAEDRHWRFYTPRRLSALLVQFHGVICSSLPLVDVFGAYHPDTRHFGPILDENEITVPSTDETLRVAITGGAFRKSASHREIMPAILDLAATDPAIILMAPKDFDHAPSGSFQSQPMARVASFPQFLKAWRQGRPSVLLHPRSSTENETFKTPNALLVALYLGAIPIVHRDEPAYAGFDASAGVLKAASAPEWSNAMRLARDPAIRRTLWDALLRSCRTHFGSAQQVDILDRLGRTHPALTAEKIAARHATITRLRFLDPASARLIARAARRLAARSTF